MRIKALIFMIFIAAGFLNAQSIVPGKSEINIKEYVNKQIKEAEAKKNIINTKKVVTVKKNKTINQNEVSKFLTDNKSSILKGFFLVDASILAAIIILWRRRQLKIAHAKTLLVKDNIQLIREEKIGLEYRKERQNKFNLFINDNLKLDSSETITKLAKKLSISKGEVHLAAKMKMLASN